MLQASALFSQVNVKPLHRVSTRQEQQAELMEQNQNLVAAKEELQKNLTDTQVQKAKLINTPRIVLKCYFRVNVW